MPDIYAQHSAAFASVEAYVILDGNGDLVARIAFKHPRDGAGRLYAYAHWIGTKMVRGFASGGGYDKHSAACASAERQLRLSDGHGVDTPLHDFWNALSKDDGRRWEHHLEYAGFRVLQAV